MLGKGFGLKSAMLLVLVAAFGCVIPHKPTVQLNKLNYLYNAAVADAAYPEESEVYKNLVAIDKSNPDLIWKTIDGEDHVLMLSWKSDKSYYPASGPYNTKKWPIWVTAAPQLLNRMKAEKTKDVNLRLKQLLGLPPSGDYKYFIEFWVKPEDMFRPCVDDEITDKQCVSCGFGDTTTYHSTWINRTRVQRYYPCGLDNKYPWTQLGYTYDWNPKNRTHVGLSEFVIRAGRDIVVKQAYTTQEYLDKE